MYHHRPPPSVCWTLCASVLNQEMIASFFDAMEQVKSEGAAKKGRSADSGSDVATDDLSDGVWSNAGSASHFSVGCE